MFDRDYTSFVIPCGDRLVQVRQQLAAMNIVREL